MSAPKRPWNPVFDRSVPTPQSKQRRLNKDMAPGAIIDTSSPLPNGLDKHIVKSATKVVIAGAGPAGLMLATLLARFGVSLEVLDDRDEWTPTGRADGLQPKTIETFKQMRIAEPMLLKGVKVYEISYWESTRTQRLRRTGRQIHYPEHVGSKNPYILLVHQGMVEELFLEELATREVYVRRDSPFLGFRRVVGKNRPLEITYRDGPLLREVGKIRAEYLVGTDGAHSTVRASVPDIRMEGESGGASWGVLDGVIETDFPDIWTKCFVKSETADGTVLCIPRERGMTRLYIELASSKVGVPEPNVTEELVMERAREIFKPYHLEWKGIEWFGNYRIGQRVASKFASADQRLFIAGDAAHTHSPKAAQGMNTSMHDTFNLAWKLNLAVRGLAKPLLLGTYEEERRKIAQDLINFDREHVESFKLGGAALTENFDLNIRFISGCGAEYRPSVLNIPEKESHNGLLRAGALLPSVKVTRFIDINPIDIELDIPILGQFRIYFFVPDIHKAKSFLDQVCHHVHSVTSVLGNVSLRMEKSLAMMGPLPVESDGYIQPQRYHPVSPLATYAVVTNTPKESVEIAHLPPLLQASRWTFYLDDIDAKEGGGCMKMWLGDVPAGSANLVVVRPDGYLATIGRWEKADGPAAVSAGKWLDEYFGGFLQHS
ncbi:MAG: hypothetical protein M1834_006376 [Cirrosporium novae-zelandiae]|nr:MAG: hypothetical protein M1834_006376 [Cirrosporium novae-zelandiae]